MSMSISERLRIIPLALAPDADRWTGNPTTDWIKCEGSVCFIVVEGAGGTGTVTITLNCSAANTGSSPTALAYRYRLLTTAGGLDTWGAWQDATATGILPAAGANKATLVEVTADELTEGKPYVALTLTETDSTAVDGAVFALVDNDYKGTTTVSVL